MYSILRKIHFYSAFVIASFLLMFFITGGVMIMENIFPRENQSQTIQAINIDSSLSEIEKINFIKNQFKVRGIERREQSDSLVIFTFDRPGHYVRVSMPGNASNAEVRITKGTFSTVMNYYHRIRGFDRDFMHTLWAVFYDLSSLALIVFAITGIYLWWKLIPDKSTGLIFFFISTGLTAFTIIYMMIVC